MPHPTGSEVWACNKRQTVSLESIQLKKIVGCSSKICNESVRGDMRVLEREEG